MSIQVLLVDDQSLVREGIKSLISLTDDVVVAAEASDGSQVLHALELHSIDVILMDLSMPVMDGISTIELLTTKDIYIPIIILTTFDDHELILRGIKAGARGYLLKDVSLETLLEAIKKVHRGERLIQPAITERLLEGLGNFTSENNSRYESNVHIEPLSKKELEVIRLMASGCSNKEISVALHNSEGTIKNHVSSILMKLGVRDRTRAVLLAIEKGVI